MIFFIARYIKNVGLLSILVLTQKVLQKPQNGQIIRSEKKEMAKNLGFGVTG